MNFLLSISDLRIALAWNSPNCSYSLFAAWLFDVITNQITNNIKDNVLIPVISYIIGFGTFLNTDDVSRSRTKITIESV